VKIVNPVNRVNVVDLAGNAGFGELFGVVEMLAKL